MMTTASISGWEEERGTIAPQCQEKPGNNSSSSGKKKREKKKKEEKEEEGEKDLPESDWQQPLWYPCNSPGVFAYSILCCCCAMGDIGCYTKKTFFCYPLFCLLAPCPCCVGLAREIVAEKYNLEVTDSDPDDCSWCFVKIVGARLLCFISLCCFPCIHVTQMRAELAYRRHGVPSLCPCCCFECGDAEFEFQGPSAQPDYPKQQTIQRA